MRYEEDDDAQEPMRRRRLPLMAHGSVSRNFILFLIAAVSVLVYGWILVTTPTEQDKSVCTAWLQQYSERVNSAKAFEQSGCNYKGISATSHGIYSTVTIRVDKHCEELPRMLDVYFSHNKLGLLMFVRLYAGEEETPCMSTTY